MHMRCVCACAARVCVRGVVCNRQMWQHTTESMHIKWFISIGQMHWKMQLLSLYNIKHTYLWANTGLPVHLYGEENNQIEHYGHCWCAREDTVCLSHPHTYIYCIYFSHFEFLSRILSFFASNWYCCMYRWSDSIGNAIDFAFFRLLLPILLLCFILIDIHSIMYRMRLIVCM